jgi:hypothetical protein
MLDVDRVRAALTSYEVGGELGRGAWGVVLEGRHLQLDREVAIKQLPRAFAADPHVRSRFVAEARLLASLDHPHIVPIYDFVEADGLCLLVMERLSGGTVWSRFLTSGISAQAACALVLAAASGLQAAHEKGILHRDIKPENLLLSSTGQLKVADFGIAKVVGGNETLTTRAGEVLGTPQYMAPEQAQAGELGPQVDVYSTGVMLYELLSGRLPFADEGDAFAVLYRHIHETPEPLSRAAPELPQDISSVVMQALATEPSDRFPTAETFGVALAEAATSAWGPGWPTALGNLGVMGSPQIVAATERYTTDSAHAHGAAPATVVKLANPPVRATTAVRAASPPVPDEARAVLLSVREIIDHPPFPRRHVALAAGFIAGCIALGFLGLPRSFDGNLPKGALTVDGIDPARGQPVVMDLDQPISVAGRLSDRASPDVLVLQLSTAGVSLGSTRAEVAQQADGSFTSVVDMAQLRYVAGGRVTGNLSLEMGGSSVGEVAFPVEAARPGFLTLPGAVCIGLILFVAAYAESILRTLRKGRRQRIGRIALGTLGALMGSALAVAASLLIGQEPNFISAVAGAGLGVAAGIASAGAAFEIGRFRRLARSSRFR